MHYHDKYGHDHDGGDMPHEHLTEGQKEIIEELVEVVEGSEEGSHEEEHESEEESVEVEEEVVEEEVEGSHEEEVVPISLDVEEIEEKPKLRRPAPGFSRRRHRR